MAPGRPTGPSNALCLWFARQARSLAHPALVPAIPHGPSLHERPCCHPALTLLARRERTGGDRRRSVVALLRSGGEEPALDFRILGPFEVLRSGEPVHVPRGKQQAVLALLTAHVGRVVPAERLGAELWGGGPRRADPPPPASATSSRAGAARAMRTTGTTVIGSGGIDSIGSRSGTVSRAATNARTAP